MARDVIQVRSNLKLIARERGKIVARRQGHNIWLDLGGEFLAQLIAYSAFGPDTTYRNDRVKYVGYGIGGTRQLALAVANAAPLVTHYPGTNVYTDTDPTLTKMERPVRISGGSSTPPYPPGDNWLGQIQAPPTFPTAKSVLFKRVLDFAEVSYAPYTTVPLSEVMLFTAAANPQVYNNTGIAYDTFDTISKTNAIAIETEWEIRFS